MRVGGKILREIIENVCCLAAPGISTWELETLARKLFRERKLQPSFLGYKGFPAALCTSINEEIVHGIPSARRILKSGDILKIDAGLLYRGFHTDCAVTIPIGDVNSESLGLMKATRDSLDAGIARACPGNRLGDVSHAIQEVVQSYGFSVVRDYTGHGIGRKLHEGPQIPNYGREDSGPRLKTGMALALEPMVNAGGHETRLLDDEWTVITADGRRSAHFEHTIVITDNGPQILTVV